MVRKRSDRCQTEKYGQIQVRWRSDESQLLFGSRSKRQAGQTESYRLCTEKNFTLSPPCRYTLATRSKLTIRYSLRGCAHIKTLVVFFVNATRVASAFFRRRLRAEGAKPKSNKRWKTGLGHVCMYVCMYICMFFTYISQFTAHTEFKSVPFASPLNATLLRNEFSWVRYPTSA